MCKVNVLRKSLKLLLIFMKLRYANYVMQFMTMKMFLSTLEMWCFNVCISFVTRLSMMKSNISCEMISWIMIMMCWRDHVCSELQMDTNWLIITLLFCHCVLFYSSVEERRRLDNNTLTIAGTFDLFLAMHLFFMCHYIFEVTVNTVVHNWKPVCQEQLSSVLWFDFLSVVQVNSYKQHLAAVKSLLPDRLSHRPVSIYSL